MDDQRVSNQPASFSQARLDHQKLDRDGTPKIIIEIIEIGEPLPRHDVVHCYLGIYSMYVWSTEVQIPVIPPSLLYSTVQYHVNNTSMLATKYLLQRCSRRIGPSLPAKRSFGTFHVPGTRDSF